MKTMRLAVGIILASSLFGQEFRLGMTKAEVHKTFGKPVGYFDWELKRYLTAPAGLAVSRQLGHSVYDVYFRTTRSNTYEFRISYGLDASQSRFNPVERVEVVNFELDKPTTDLKSFIVGYFGDGAHLPQRMCDF
jgi:hypothetical protein